ncbi:hypothetical protein OIU77_005531 [Salix suchowensis]|uniref:Uncharacterized protein n=1 Tax=Salix suchowensis TaxID=1278906 RepID=A0ABQ9APR0_9ROSI|nr:hypothetical protein OIU77_005531 [Salix suchowensis]
MGSFRNFKKPKRATISQSFRNLNITIGNLLLQIFWIFPINSTPDRNTSPQNLLHCPAQILSYRSRTHNLGNLDDIIKRYIPIMLYVLGLLPVSLGLLQRLDNQSRG